jgi:hypothetical protein
MKEINTSNINMPKGQINGGSSCDRYSVFFRDLNLIEVSELNSIVWLKMIYMSILNFETR